MTDSLATTASTKVLLKDCCEEISQRIDNPAESGFERFVGLEHLKTGETSIRNWGSTEDVTSSMKLFKAGDVIVARRNVYLRRAARAHFDGVCSGDGIVLRGKSGICLPDLLPFLLNTDAFWDYVTSQADGTMSKRITVKRLLSYEFALPPLEEQRRIVEVLQAAEASKEAAQALKGACTVAKAAFVESFIQRNPPTTELDLVLDETAYGTSSRASAEEKGLPVLRIPNVARGEINLDELKWIEMIDEDVNRYRVDDGDILIVRTNGNPDYVGRCVVVRDLPRTFVYASYLIRMRADLEQVEPEFITAMLNAPTIRRVMRGAIRSSAGNYNLNTQGIRRQRIPLPGIDGQREFLNDYAEISNRADSAGRRVAELQKVQSSLLMEIGR